MRGHSAADRSGPSAQVSRPSARSAPGLLELKDGRIDVPATPGLGIEIDGAAVERLAVDRLVME